MSCYHPLLGLRDGLTESGKPHYSLHSFDDSVLDNFPKEDVVQIPCGKCIGCRLDYARQWSDRMMMESQCHENNYFITLTYDDDQIPPVYYYKDGKECVKLGSLRKRDIQLFNKSLRSWLERNGYDSKFKYYVCGEYGSQTFRPHYHGIYFGLNLPDVVNKPGNILSECGEPVLESDILTSIWKKGFTELGSVTPASCSYVARYVTKKALSDDRNLQESLGIEPEFNLMSRRKAIGRQFYDDNPDMFDTGKYFLGTEKGSVKIYPSRYFRNLKDSDENKLNRYVAGKINRKSGDNLTDLSYSERLNISEYNKNQQINILKNREI